MRHSFRTLVLRWLFALSMALAIFSGGYLYWKLPATITIAVGPPGSQLVAYIESLAQAFRTSREAFRIKIVATAGSRESSALLDRGAVDFAVLRSDDQTSQNARALVIVHRDTLMFVIRKSKSVDLLQTIDTGRGEMFESSGNTFIGVISELFNHYGVEGASLRLQPLNRNDIVKAFMEKRIDYAVALGHPSDREFSQLILSLRQVLGDDFLLMGPPAAKGLAEQIRGLEKNELTEGIIGGAPPLPLATIASVSVTHELAASKDFNERTVGALTKTLMDLRTRLRGMNDGGLRIEAPALDEPRRFLPHAGAAMHFNGESKTLLEAYSDILWLGLFALGFIGSALSALFAWLGLGRAKTFDET